MEEDKKDLEKQETDKEVPEKQEYNKKELDARLKEAVHRAGHRWRNRFHLELPFGFTGSVKGLVFFEGEYHLFCQWNPFSTEDKNKGWVEFKTRDFIYWSEPRLVLWPTGDDDRDGCGSGSAFINGGRLRILYTGRREEEGRRANHQILGTLTKEGVIRKDMVLLKEPPEGYTDLFQGPHFFVRNNHAYMVLGAQAEPADDARGCALLYREEKGVFKLLGELKTQLGFFGRVWECPAMLRFGNHDVFLFSPRGVPDREFSYQNLFQSGYVAGHLSLAAQEMLHGSFHELDRGFDFFVPHVGTHEGRNILFGWMSMPHNDEEYPTGAEGWMHTLTLPRVMSFRQGKLFSKPAPELKALRIERSARELSGRDVPSLKTEIDYCTEILLNIVFGAAERVKTELRYAREKVTITYDRGTDVVEISREGMKLGGRGVRRFKLYTYHALVMHIFIDKTAIEIFFQNGEEVASFLVFPEKDVQPVFALEADAPMEKVMGTIWELDRLRYGQSKPQKRKYII